ncbi:MAG: ASCH domain-containing protein [Candidatus Riflebacteria bacterium]
MLALSIVKPHGANIAEGRKTLEIRSWRPEELPLRNLIIVENSRYLTAEMPEEGNALAVAVVDIEEVHEWQPDEVEAACSQAWQPGYFAWKIANVRKINPPIAAPARRKLYELEITVPLI